MDIHISNNISDRIVERLLERIRAEGLREGDVLPSERELMREFDVSRLACREAMAKLQGMGVLRTRHGKGAYLADIRNLAVSPALLKLLDVRSDTSNAEVLEARLIIEPAAAEFAARRANAGQKKAISRQTQKSIRDLGELPVIERAQTFAEADVAFHQMVATASGNPVFPLLLKSMHELLLRVRLEVLILKPGIARRALADHRKIAAAIAFGDGQAAAKAMEQHIRLRGKELLKERID